MQDVGTREGLRVLVQAYVAWQVDDDPVHIAQFLRAGRRDPDDIARQLRSFMGSTLQMTASNFDLTRSGRYRSEERRGFEAFERRLQSALYQQVLDTYGIRIVQTGVERFSLPAETLAATVARMRAERETVAAQRTANGMRTAAAIRSDAARDARLIGAKAEQEAAEIKAKGREQAAAIHAAAYALDPQLYDLLRSLDTLGSTVGPKTRVILRTDAAPFRALVDGPPLGTPPAARCRRFAAQWDRRATGAGRAENEMKIDSSRSREESRGRVPRSDFGPAGYVRLGFRAGFAALLLLVLGWAVGGFRQVPPDSRVVVQRFGQVERVQEAGLVLAWPNPIEQITLVPAYDRQIAVKIEAPANSGPTPETDFQVRQPDDVVTLRQQKDAWNGQYFLTGDGYVVQFDATLYFRVIDPGAYVLSRDHVAPALQRLYRASAAMVASGHDLDDFLVARPENSDQPVSAEVAGRREAWRGQLISGINQRLATLRRASADLGVEVGRIDIVALLPPLAKAAFNDVLTASQIADQTMAAARTDATRTLQEAQRGHDRSAAEATAAAEEQIRTAAAETADVGVLHGELSSENRGQPARAILSRPYRRYSA